MDLVVSWFVGYFIRIIRLLAGFVVFGFREPKYSERWGGDGEAPADEEGCRLRVVLARLVFADLLAFDEDHALVRLRVAAKWFSSFVELNVTSFVRPQDRLWARIRITTELCPQKDRKVPRASTSARRAHR